MEEPIIKFNKTFAYNLIYVFRINDDAHQDILKVGLSSVNFDENPNNIFPNHKILNNAAKKRIDQYTKTAGIVYELLYTELAIDYNNVAFRDQDVHKVLLNSGIKKKCLTSGANEWFKTDLNTAKNAINAVKEGKSSLFQSEITKDKNPIVLRPNQQEAVDKTKKQFKNHDSMLWNAKMRFGKTLSALQVVKDLKYKKTIIMTHRPVVDDGWFEDFEKIFYDTDTYKYGSKSSNHGDRIDVLEKEGVNYVYFASIQDLRGSSTVGGKFDKNNKVFKIDWDLVIVDEAHEGTGTLLGEEVIKHIVKSDNNHKTKLLELSGTPFNLLDKFEEDQIYTWDYVMEQREKLNWYVDHYGDPNPYEDLPKMNIFTYNLDNEIDGFNDYEDMAFNFREFFRVWIDNPEVDRRVMPKTAKIGEFVHKDDVRRFLDLLCNNAETSNYPFSKQEYREYFRHSLWMIPGVKEAKALSKLLHDHPVFGSGAFKIVNVAGEGDDFEEKNYNDAKKMVEDAISDHPEDTYTITLSCGRLTTGVSIKAWTAIFMLSGSASVSASSYLQTIFRAQTPAKIGGQFKDSCYVFDFSPDRTLKMVAEAGELSTRRGSVDIDGQEQMREFLNFCPVIGVSGSTMEVYDVNNMLQQLKRAHADRVVRNGFDDSNLYNDSLLKLDNLELEQFNELRDIIGSAKAQGKTEKIDVNKQGFTDEEWKALQEAKKKKKKELTPEQKEALEKLKEAKKQQRKAVDILRGISIRIPMLIYGADIAFDKEVAIDNFLDIVDDASWEEFMPKGVTKDKFKQFSKYYDVDVFIAAGRKIRNIAKSADKLNPTERVKKIAGLFATFKNPDKETVLTPWRVVNMHMSDTLGGWCFYDDSFDELNGKLVEPRYVSHPEVTINTLSTESSKILELNSKTGLYPLYIAYSIYKQRCINCDSKKLDENKETELWQSTIQDNVFVVCKTKMASTITKRTLNGYKDANFNVLPYENIIDLIQNYSDKFCIEIKNPKTWKKDSDEMKFNAIVGNPPYQMDDGGNGSSAKPLYHKFVELAEKIKPDYVSMITPSRWFAGGKGLDSFREMMLSDKKISKMVDFVNAKDCFTGISIGGGVNYFLRTRQTNELCDYYNVHDGKKSRASRNLNEFSVFVRYNEAINIIHKVEKIGEERVSKYVNSRNPFGFSSAYRGSDSKDDYNDITLFTSKGQYYVTNSDVKQNREMIDDYKVMISKVTSEHAGEPSKDGLFTVLSTIKKLLPNEICTDSYLIIYNSKNEDEVQNYINYAKTKFYRFLLLQSISSINLSKDKFEFIPMLDFSQSWNDDKLFNKYKLSLKEVEYINNLINNKK